MREVKRARRAAVVDPGQGELLPSAEPVTREVPVRYSLELTPEQEARRAALVERLHKLGAAPADRAELLLDALAALVASHEGPRGPSRPVQIHVHERGGKLLVPTNQGERELGRADTERLRCDAIICKKGRRAKATIPPRVHREVLARDGHRCQSPGCDRTHFLEVHHRTPRAKGGTHDPANLVTLCASCHRLHHEKGSLVREPFLALRSKVPGDLVPGSAAGPGTTDQPGTAWGPAP
ncbi:MAG: HNH endonuclease [bacterium]|nr:HNH endonuclease [bacterium]